MDNNEINTNNNANIEDENVLTQEVESENTESVKETGTQNRPKMRKKKSKKQEKNTIGSEVLSWVKTIILALILAYLITNFLIVNAVVPSASMETTVMTGDRLVANRLSYMLSDPERFDIVVFKYPDDESILYIKRIIGMPGETIQIKDGNVYVNGESNPLRCDFINEYMDTSDPTRYPAEFTIPKKGDNISDYKGITDSSVYDEDGDGKFDEDCYFMMGDNRNKSSDSRFWANKYLSRNKMEGKAVFRYWPLNTIGLVK